MPDTFKTVQQRCNILKARLKQFGIDVHFPTGDENPSTGHRTLVVRKLDNIDIIERKAKDIVERIKEYKEENNKPRDPDSFLFRDIWNTP